jgi:hypothetical protein
MHSTMPLPTLCISGRGAFDEVAAAIAVQLLGRHNITTVATTYEQFRNTRSEAREADSATILCVVSLDAAESPPYLRNLLRRIRNQPKPRTVIVGFGGLSESALDDATAGNTRNATTFRGLIEECLAAALATPRDEQARHEQTQGAA